jgi:hypothetical protein
MIPWDRKDDLNGPDQGPQEYEHEKAELGEQADAESKTSETSRPI